MHNAPPVDYPVGRFAGWAWCGGVLGAALVIMMAERLAAWLQHADVQPVGGLLLASVSTVAWCLTAWRRWRHAPQGLLRWQPDASGLPGDGWFWCQGLRCEPCRVHGVLDLGSSWLVRATSDGRSAVPHWLWLSASQAPSRWQDMRRAVWASRGNPDAIDRSVIFPRA